MSDISQDPGLGPDVRKPAVDVRSVAAVPEERSTQFVAVSGAAQENTSATTMLVTAYALFWIVLMGFIWMTWRHQQRIGARLRQLEVQLAKLNSGEQK
jgi:heme/copper-type cytochrome/quinol oxidase subunit 2